ncbi:hypothetical protein GGX14DRAFT_117811 [Mycena pura]|uniref:Uncharacterized protein n=1 Tax=Mycena pura TaxID=153505 RepID=A0AAD6VAZ0_9AGAR|nr:hypothetical protein GGX14DRAFT_117811 [Mycena pura]
MISPNSRASRFVIITSRASDSDKSFNIAWISPVADVTYPSDMILAKWTSSETINSPSFKLCATTSKDLQRSLGDKDSSGTCGVALWAPVTENAGVYQAPVTVPNNVLPNREYYLQMEDDAGNKMDSPVFALGAGAPSASNDPQSVTGVEPQAQAPFGSSNPSSVPVAPVAAPVASPLYPGSPAAVSASVSASTSSALNHISTAAAFDPDILSVKTPASTAAFAVPLSVVAVVILIASGLFLRHRRKVNAQCVKDAEKLPRAGTVHSFKSNSSRGSEVELALHVLSRHQECTHSPVSLFMPPQDRVKGRTRSVSTPYAYPYPSYAFDGRVTQRRGSMCFGNTSSVVEHPKRPRLPPIATAGSFETDPVTNVILADYMLPSPTLRSSTSTPRCLLPAPQKLHLRDSTSQSHGTTNPLGSPRSDRYREDRDLYARVESKLDMYRRS